MKNLVCVLVLLFTAFAFNARAQVDEPTTRTVSITFKTIRDNPPEFWTSFLPRVQESPLTNAQKMTLLSKVWPYAINSTWAELDNLWLECALAEKKVIIQVARTLIEERRAIAQIKADDLLALRDALE